MDFKNELNQNNTDLQSILDKVNSLPTEEELTPSIEELLPSLDNPAGAANIVSGYEAIDQNGNKVIGTYEGVNINGIIESYKVAASENISAGDFVSFLNGNVEGGTDTAINTSSRTGSTISAVALDDNRVFIAHNYGTNNYMYGIVVTVSKTAITVGASTTLSTTDGNAGYRISVVKLSSDKVFIAHSYGASMYLYGMVCTINDTTITKGTDTQLNSAKQYGYFISAVALSENKVFIAGAYNSSSYYLYAIVCTINGTTITKGSITSLSSTTHTGDYINVTALSDSKVFIAHSYSTAEYLYGMVCTISGTTITQGNDTQLSTIVNAGFAISAVALSDNKVFIAHGYGSDIYLYGMICTISGTTITAGTDKKISEIGSAGMAISTVLTGEDAVFIAHSCATNAAYDLYGVICTINETSIVVGTDTLLVSAGTDVSNYLSATLLSDDKVFIAHSYNTSYYLYGIVAMFASGVIPYNGELLGIANQSGTGGDIIEVYVAEPITFEFYVRDDGTDPVTTYTCVATKSMTWRKWIESKYNIHGFFIENYNVLTQSRWVVFDPDTAPVDPETVIVAGKTYNTM